MDTRYTEQTGIVIARQKISRSKVRWGHFDTNDGLLSHVGPWYKTKAEALADHYDYLIRGGWLRPNA